MNKLNKFVFTKRKLSKCFLVNKNSFSKLKYSTYKKEDNFASNQQEDKLGDFVKNIYHEAKELHPTPEDTSTIVHMYSYSYGMVAGALLLAGGITFLIHSFKKGETTNQKEEELKGIKIQEDK